MKINVYIPEHLYDPESEPEIEFVYYASKDESNRTIYSHVYGDFVELYEHQLDISHIGFESEC